MWRIRTISLAAILLVAAAPPAAANWKISKLTNAYGQTVSISTPFLTGQSRSGDAVFQSADAAVAVPGQGPILFLNQDHNTGCERPYWGVAITYMNKSWGFYYDGGGTVEVNVHSDGTVSFVAGPAGQIVVGDGPPKCQ